MVPSSRPTTNTVCGVENGAHCKARNPRIPSFSNPLEPARTHDALQPVQIEESHCTLSWLSATVAVSSLGGVRDRGAEWPWFRRPEIRARLPSIRGRKQTRCSVFLALSMPQRFSSSDQT